MFQRYCNGEHNIQTSYDIPINMRTALVACSRVEDNNNGVAQTQVHIGVVFNYDKNLGNMSDSIKGREFIAKATGRTFQSLESSGKKAANFGEHLPNNYRSMAFSYNRELVDVHSTIQGRKHFENLLMASLLCVYEGALCRSA